MSMVPCLLGSDRYSPFGSNFYPPKGSMSMAGPRPLTSTSYAILGLLSLRPWTTYELAQQMQRALGQFWPRAESKLYEEPKKLVEHGLAKATVEHVGKRPRTVYAITPAGRKALKAWMPEPSDGPVDRVRGAGAGVLRRARHQGRPAGRDRLGARLGRAPLRGERGHLARLPRRRGRLPRAAAVADPVRSLPAGDDQRRRALGGLGHARPSRRGPTTSRQPSPTSRPSRRWPCSPRPTQPPGERAS